MQDPLDLAEVPRKAREPDVLEHADAGDLVEERILRAGRGSPAARTSHAVRRARARAIALVHVVELVLRQRDAGRLDAVALRRVQDERAPAAADVEEALARARAAACGRCGRASAACACVERLVVPSGNRRTSRPCARRATAR